MEYWIEDFRGMWQDFIRDPLLAKYSLGHLFFNHLEISSISQIRIGNVCRELGFRL